LHQGQRELNPGGSCQLDHRSRMNFGVMTIRRLICAVCGEGCRNEGCGACKQRFCAKHLAEHLDAAPKVQWMWADAGTLIPVFAGMRKEMAKRNKARWSPTMNVSEAILAFEQQTAARPVRLSIECLGTTIEKEFEKGPAQAKEELERGELRSDLGLDGVFKRSCSSASM